VSAVLLRNITVSVLDSRVRFDYPERALAGHLLNLKGKTCTDAQIPAVGIEDQHRGPEVKTWASYLPGEPPFWASYCAIALQLMLHL
jgi:hypothetical protein